MSVTPSSRIRSPVTAETEAETSKSFCSRFVAVTTTSSSDASAAEAVDAANIAAAPQVNATKIRVLKFIDVSLRRMVVAC